MLNSLLRSACRIPVSRFSTSQCSRGWVRDPKKFKELQKPFLVDDGVPMYLKKGGVDRAIFAFISLYTVAVLVYCGHFSYRMVYPPKTD